MVNGDNESGIYVHATAYKAIPASLPVAPYIQNQATQEEERKKWS